MPTHDQETLTPPLADSTAPPPEAAPVMTWGVSRSAFDVGSVQLTLWSRRYAELRKQATAAHRERYVASAREAVATSEARTRFTDLAAKLEAARAEVSTLERRVQRSLLDETDLLASPSNGMQIAQDLARLQGERDSWAATLRELQTGIGILEQQVGSAHAALTQAVHRALADAEYRARQQAEKDLAASQADLNAVAAALSAQLDSVALANLGMQATDVLGSVRDQLRAELLPALPDGAVLPKVPIHEQMRRRQESAAELLSRSRRESAAAELADIARLRRESLAAANARSAAERSAAKR